MNALPVGALAYKTRQNLTFKYDSNWLGRSNTFPISRSLPLTEEVYEGSRVFAYFDNLLPDAKGTPVSISEIADKLRNLGTVPLAASDEDDFRLSIAGAQEKTAFLSFNKEWHIPQDVAASIFDGMNKRSQQFGKISG